MTEVLQFGPSLTETKAEVTDGTIHSAISEQMFLYFPEVSNIHKI
jgi:hypothetical protein